jgi:hypothetical protein
MALAFNDMGSNRRSVGITPAFNRAYTRTFGTIKSRMNAGTYDPLADWGKMTFDVQTKYNKDYTDAWAENDRLLDNKDYAYTHGQSKTMWDAEIDANDARIAQLTDPNYKNTMYGNEYDKLGLSSAEKQYMEELRAGQSGSDMVTF